MGFYDEMRSVASDLLTQFGNPFILRKPNDKPVYDPKTKKTVVKFSDFNGICVMKTYSDEAIGMLGNIIESGDVSFVCLLEDISIIPQADKDKLIYNNIAYNIIRVQTSNPSGKKILVHTLQCRRTGE